MIQSTLQVDQLRFTTNLAVAARASMTGRHFLPDDIYRLLVWHTPGFGAYAQAMLVLRTAVQTHQIVHVMVQPISPALFLLTLHRPSGGDPMSVQAGVLLELHTEGHVLHAEMLGDRAGVLTASYREITAREVSLQWLDTIEQSWSRTPITLPPRELTAKPKPKFPPKSQQARAARAAAPVPVDPREPRKTRGERPQPPAITPVQTPVVASVVPLTQAKPIKASRRQNQRARFEARQLSERAVQPASNEAVQEIQA